MREKHAVLGRSNTKKYFTLNRPLTNIRLSDLTFDDLYQDISNNWQEKALKLQARRWRKIKHQII